MSAKRKKSASTRSPAAGSKTAPSSIGFMSRLSSSPVYGAVIIFLLSFLLFSNTLTHEFVWDDRDLIVDNPRIQSLDGGSMRSIFLDNFFQGKSRVGGYYRPLVSLSYHLDYQLFGGSPAGFHLTNVVINALCASLLFLLLCSLFGVGGLAWIGSIAFAALPLHTENVAWVAGRTDLMATMWMLFSLLCYVRFKRQRNPLSLSLCLFGFIFALLSKEIAVVLPLFIVLTEAGMFPAGPAAAETGGSTPAKRYFVPVAACLAILALYFFLRREVLGGVSEFEPYTDGPVKTITLALNIFAGYAFKLLFPFRLSAEYDAPVPLSAWHPHAAAGLVLLALILSAAWRFRRRAGVTLAACFFLAGLAPVMNLIPLGEISAERFLYFPSIGFAVLLGITGAAILSGRGGLLQYRTALLAGLALLLIGYGVQTVARNGVWKNEEVLFTRTVQDSPGSARAHLNVANVHRQRGRTREAIAGLETALTLEPDYVDAMSNLAGIYMSLGETRKSIPLIQRAASLAPDNADLQNNLAIIYIQQGQLDEAERVLGTALAASPDHPRASFNLGLVKFEKQQYAEAYPLFAAVRDAGPEFIRSGYYLGAIDIQLGNLDSARKALKNYLSRSPSGDPFRARAEGLLRSIENGGR